MGPIPRNVSIHPIPCQVANFVRLFWRRHQNEEAAAAATWPLTQPNREQLTGLLDLLLLVLSSHDSISHAIRTAGDHYSPQHLRKDTVIQHDAKQTSQNRDSNSSKINQLNLLLLNLSLLTFLTFKNSFNFFLLINLIFKHISK